VGYLDAAWGVEGVFIADFDGDGAGLAEFESEGAACAEGDTEAAAADDGGEVVAVEAAEVVSVLLGFVETACGAGVHSGRVR
jgi:hypothetical protein